MRCCCWQVAVALGGGSAAVALLSRDLGTTLAVQNALGGTYSPLLEPKTTRCWLASVLLPLAKAVAAFFGACGTTSAADARRTRHDHPTCLGRQLLPGAPLIVSRRGAAFKSGQPALHAVAHGHNP